MGRRPPACRWIAAPPESRPAPAMSRLKVQLEELRGAHPGRRLDFLGPRVRIGRSPDSDFAFDAQVDLQASYQHAEIHFDADGLVLIDVGSSNGTFINGR